MEGPRENGSGPVVDALGDPLIDFDGIPADGAHTQAQRLRELALLHQVVDVGTLEAGLRFDFFQTQNAALVGWQYRCLRHGGHRSEEHTSELQSLMRISYAVFCVKK